METKKSSKRGGARRGAGRKPKAGKPRDYTTVRILREAYETIPDGVNKCDYVSAVLIERAGK